MFTLMHGFYKYLIQKDEYCVLILGLDDAGKTVSSHQSSIMTIERNRYIRNFAICIVDIFGSSQNEIHQELQGNEPEIHNNNGGPEHWHH